MSTEIIYLTLAALFTGLLWVPYILALIMQMGLVAALMDTEHEFRLEQAWARRAQRAHNNNVENLVVFAAVVAALELSETNTALTAAAAAVYFWSRLAHTAVYLARVPVVRTLLFSVGVACQIIIGLTVLGLA